MADRRSPTTAAFYAREGGVLSQWWTLLHPPYTLWHLSYVVIGAALAPELSWSMLAATVVAFFLAVGVAAHALDELNGRPLGTAIGSRTLAVVAALRDVMRQPRYHDPRDPRHADLRWSMPCGSFYRFDR